MQPVDGAKLRVIAVAATAVAMQPLAEAAGRGGEWRLLALVGGRVAGVVHQEVHPASMFDLDRRQRQVLTFQRVACGHASAGSGFQPAIQPGSAAAGIGRAMP